MLIDTIPIMISIVPFLIKRIYIRSAFGYTSCYTATRHTLLSDSTSIQSYSPSTLNVTQKIILQYTPNRVFRKQPFTASRLWALLSREEASEIRRQTERAEGWRVRNPKRQHFDGSQGQRWGGVAAARGFAGNKFCTWSIAELPARLGR